jgi:Glycosyl hydrolases family 43
VVVVWLTALVAGAGPSWADAGGSTSVAPDHPATAGTVINPVPPGVAPLGTGGPAPLFAQDAPDPFVLPVGSTYYLFTTQQYHDLKNVPMWQSTDLASWQTRGDAMPTLPGWAVPGHTWAPSILRVAGGYRMFFTARHVSGHECIGTSTSASPAGPYVPSEELLICQMDRGGSIDPMVFTDTDGSNYLYWKSDDNSIGKPSTLWVQQLGADDVTLLGTPVPLLNQDQPWEPPTIEAPAMVHAAGRYWLFYSGNGLGLANYAIGYALCAGPFGPCVKQTTARPWFASNAAVAGPGEESFFADDNGNMWMAYDGWPPTNVDYPYGGYRAPRLAMVLFRPDQPPSAPPPGRAVAANPKGGYYVLTGDGDVMAFGGAPFLGAPRFGWDIARSIAVMPDGEGYVVLDGWGGLHLYGSATGLPVNPYVYWRGWDIARSIAVMPDGQGYVLLDGYGGIHTSGTAGALPPNPTSNWPGWDIARSIAVMPDGQGDVVLDGWGGTHVSGSATHLPVGSNTYWRGFDVARTIVVTSSDQGYAVLDAFGVIHPSGDAPTPAPPAALTGAWSGLALLTNGHYAVVRDDSLSADW